MQDSISNKTPDKSIISFVKAYTGKHIVNIVFEYLCLLGILLLVLILFAIILFIAKTGLLTFNDISLSSFFLSDTWVPQENKFGSLGFILGTLELTLLTMCIVLPFAIPMAVFISEIAPGYLKSAINTMLNLLVGIPSIVYGYLGITLLVPILRNITHNIMANGLLAAAIVLAVMVMPTIIRVSEDAISCVPQKYKDAAYALGANHSQVIIKSILPAAKHGITTAIILGIVRAVGETMAVVMVIGNTPQVAKSLFVPTSVLTSNIVMQITNVQNDSTWSHALYMQALLLLIICLFLIIIVRFMNRSKLA